MNRLFVVQKPVFVSSNSYLHKTKKRYHAKKAGFSGTLDPFARGCLIIAFGQYSKLFRFLKKTPKVYKGTIWLGTISESQDLEHIISVNDHKKLDEKDIKDVLNTLIGDIDYVPPKFSAKWVDGKRAYELARKSKDFELKKSIMTIFDLKLINYNHPFISFEATVSEGTYIRSLAQIILEKLDSFGTLSFLDRISEGNFCYENEKALNIIDWLDLEENTFLGDEEMLTDGKKLYKNQFKITKSGQYFISFKNFFSIIELYEEREEVKYILNRIEVC